MKSFIEAFTVVFAEGSAPHKPEPQVPEPEAPAPSAPDAGSAKPVVFHCPNCGAALRITTETKRVSTCEYATLAAATVEELRPAAMFARFIV